MSKKIVNQIPEIEIFKYMYYYNIMAPHSNGEITGEIGQTNTRIIFFFSSSR